MKDGVILVNTSRGGLVKTDDLIEGIRARKFFGVGLDVYEEETPNVFEDRSDEILEHSTTARLLSFPNVIDHFTSGILHRGSTACDCRDHTAECAGFSRQEKRPRTLSVHNGNPLENSYLIREQETTHFRRVVSFKL